MKVHVFEDAAQAGKAAAMLIAAQVLRKPDSVLGLATGSSPIPIYQELIRLKQSGIISFSQVKTFNLDEYCHLPREHACSYYRFMREQLFDPIDMGQDQFRLPDGNAQDLVQECKAYDAAIQRAGGIDLQLLGIGRNGHIGFNEPSDRFTYDTHVADLALDTIEANRRFFESGAEVPRWAISMGIGAIMAARQIVLIATGAEKAGVISKSLRGDVDPQMQASVLRLHPNVVFLLDRAAAGEPCV